MSKITHHYETLLVLDVTKSQEEQDALIEKFKSLIEKNGKIESVDLWGKRRLAYPINDLTEGFYVVIHFMADPDLPRELDRIYGITDGLLRTIIIHKDERYLDVQVKLEREMTRAPRTAAKPAAKVEPAAEEPAADAKEVTEEPAADVKEVAAEPVADAEEVVEEVNKEANEDAE